MARRIYSSKRRVIFGCVILLGILVAFTTLDARQLLASSSVIVVDGSLCTLADAITAANTDTPVGGCSAGFEADTIDLQTNVLLTTINNTTFGDTGLPVISTEITIEGNGRTIRRASNAPSFRIIAVENSNLSLNDLQIRNGLADGNDGGGIYAKNTSMIVFGSTFVENMSINTSQGGGAIYLEDGDLLVQSSNFSGNSTYQGAGIHGLRSDITIENSIFQGNEASWRGGALHLNQSTMAISASNFSENVALGANGGAIDGLNNSKITITDTDFTENFADNSGGAILVDFSDLTISNGSIISNTADFDVGGGVFATSSNVHFYDSLVAGNSASDGGGGLRVSDGSLTITRSTISQNTSVGNSNGILATSSVVLIIESTIERNAGGGLFGSGGGIAMNGDSNHLTVANSTIVDNQSSGGGGGISFDGTAIIANSTISGNWGSVGGGIKVNSFATLTLINSTVTNNEATSDGGGIRTHRGSTINLESSIVSGNIAPDGREITLDSCCQSTTTLNSNGYNIVGYSADNGLLEDDDGGEGMIINNLGFHETPSVPLTAILDSSLADNGGTTMTHALVAESPAIDNALSVNCGLSPINGYDQRRYNRNVDGNGMISLTECDSGSVEFSGVPTAISLRYLTIEKYSFLLYPLLFITILMLTRMSLSKRL